MVGGPEGPEETRGSIVARSHTQQDSCELQVAASWAVRVSLPLKTPTVKKCAEGREAQQRLELDQFVLENSIPKSQVIRLQIPSRTHLGDQIWNSWELWPERACGAWVKSRLQKPWRTHSPVLPLSPLLAHWFMPGGSSSPPLQASERCAAGPTEFAGIGSAGWFFRECMPSTFHSFRSLLTESADLMFMGLKIFKMMWK